MTRTPDGRGRERRTDTILPSVLSAREHGCPPAPPDRLPPRRGGHPSSKTASAAGRPASFAGLADARHALVRSARAVAAVACLCLAGPLALPAQAQTTNFYLWRTTMTVGESSGTLGYDKDASLGSISTDADFGYPPWNPPHKHHVDRESYYTVKAINYYVDQGYTFLVVLIDSVDEIASGPGNVTLWLNRKSFELRSTSVEPGGNSMEFSSSLDWVPNVTWSEDDEVRVALVYERRLPSAPQNVSVTAPPGEDGTLEVSWDEPDDEGTFPIECYLVEFRHPSGEAKKRKRSYPGSLGPGKGCGDSPPTSVTRTDLETGVQYQVLVQALSGDGFSEWSETKTVRANGRTPRSELTASFEGMPTKHDGERAFRFRVEFSEDIGISFRALREDAFTVTGGRVTGGSRVDGRRDLFKMTVRPDSDGDVTITLAAGRECATSGAICTKGENRRQLTNSPSATVKGPAASSAAAAPGWPDRAARLCSALAAGDGLTPSSAAAALWGDGDPGKDRLDALDSLGNGNGGYDLGDMLAWAARCRGGEASGPAAGSGPPSPPPALPASGPAGGASRQRRKRARGTGRHRRTAPDPPAARSRTRRSGWLRTALLAVLTSAWGCGDGIVDPRGGDVANASAVDPGPLHVRLTAPAQARDIGAMLVVEGPAIDSLQAPGLEMFETDESSSTRREVVIAGALPPDGPVLRVWVPHRGDHARYRVRLLQVAAEDFTLGDLSVYGSVISH